MNCPKCNGQLLLTVISDDNGENITSFYRCEYCKIELTEEEILENTEDKET